MAFLATFMLSLLGLALLSRRLEFDADERGATLLGSTEPLEALYRSKETTQKTWWEMVFTFYPNPDDQLAVLKTLSINEDDRR